MARVYVDWVEEFVFHIALVKMTNGRNYQEVVSFCINIVTVIFRNEYRFRLDETDVQILVCSFHKMTQTTWHIKHLAENILSNSPRLCNAFFTSTLPME